MLAIAQCFDHKEMTYHTLTLSRVTLDISPRQDGDPDTQGRAPRLRIKVGDVGKVQGAGITDRLPAP